VHLFLAALYAACTVGAFALWRTGVRQGGWVENPTGTANLKVSPERALRNRQILAKVCLVGAFLGIFLVALQVIRYLGSN